MEPLHFNINNFHQNIITLYKSVFCTVIRLFTNLFYSKREKVEKPISDNDIKNHTLMIN